MALTPGNQAAIIKSKISASDMINELSNGLHILKESIAKNPEIEKDVIASMLNIVSQVQKGEMQQEAPDVISKEEQIKIMEKIKKSLNCSKIKVPELRILADELAKNVGIFISSYNQKRKDYLLKWFDDHWDQLDPILRQRQQIQKLKI